MRNGFRRALCLSVLMAAMLALGAARAMVSWATA